MRMARVYPSARERILDAVERVILRDGPSAVSVDAVLREAEISKGGFFHHFATKEALLAAVTERLAAHVGVEAQKAAARDPVRHGRSLRAQIAIAFDMPPAERERTRALVLALIGAAMDGPAVRESARAANEESVAQSTAEGVDVGAALVVQLALDGYFLAESLGTTKLDAARKAAFKKTLLALTVGPGTQQKRKVRHHVR